jgi:hypothetical protein
METLLGPKLLIVADVLEAVLDSARMVGLRAAVPNAELQAIDNLTFQKGVSDVPDD